MNLDFLEKFLAKLNVPKKADPDRVHRHHVRSRAINITPKLIIICFAVIIALLAAVSAITVVKEQKKENTSEASQNSTVSESDSLTQAFAEANDEDFSGNLLLGFTRDGNSDLRFLAVINFSENNGLAVSYIPVSTMCKVKDYDATMKDHLASGGITELRWAVGERYSIAIDKYALFDEIDFVDVMKRLGDTNVTIEEQINYNYNGLSFIIEEGPQVFAPDSLLKYYVYLCDTMWDDPSKLTDITASIAKRIADFENFSVEDIYKNIINFVSTDISARDMVKYGSSIYSFFEKGSLDQIEIVNNPSEFK